MDDHALIQKQLLAIRLNSSACASPARFVGDVEAIIKAKFDEDKEAKACASVYKDGRRHLLTWVDGMFGGKFSTFDISNVPDNDLVSASSQEKTLDRVQMKLEIYKHHFAGGRIGHTLFKPLIWMSTRRTLCTKESRWWFQLRQAPSSLASSP
eukprot:TRINITY_DN33039_c0_g1_i1.p1 TRINITY_DN33039_c0_g1~~TRINITY_DN33039_c0_g1_i1.p1  ORF type:complete len:153 (-),score=34.51 TRINITY_DN33039_c0_g1_i1:196-654(-)